MYAINAFFYGGSVYLSRGQSLRSNETVVRLLNMNLGWAEDLYRKLNQLSHYLRLESDMRQDDIEAYHRRAHQAQRLIRRLDETAGQLDLYQKSVGAAYLQTDKLFGCLNQVEWVWPDDDELDEEEPGPSAGYADRTTFTPRLDHEVEDPRMLGSLAKVNPSLDTLFRRCLAFARDMWLVETVYRPLLENYIHRGRRFPDEHEAARAYADFLAHHGRGMPARTLFGGGSAQMTYEVLEEGVSGPVLCEAYHFDTLGAFLYQDFFHGLAHHFLPNRCKNCGRYFLLAGGKYSDYCESPLAGDESKTCRDIGSRKKYDEKCRTDPIWLAYNRAYKAHYARYMKKKMTAAQFERWSRYAEELRDMAEQWEVDLEDYRRNLKL